MFYRNIPHYILYLTFLVPCDLLKCNSSYVYLTKPTLVSQARVPSFEFTPYPPKIFLVASLRKKVHSSLFTQVPSFHLKGEGSLFSDLPKSRVPIFKGKGSLLHGFPLGFRVPTLGSPLPCPQVSKFWSWVHLFLAPKFSNSYLGFTSSLPQVSEFWS